MHSDFKAIKDALSVIAATSSSVMGKQTLPLNFCHSGIWKLYKLSALQWTIVLCTQMLKTTSNFIKHLIFAHLKGSLNTEQWSKHKTYKQPK